MKHIYLHVGKSLIYASLFFPLCASGAHWETCYIRIGDLSFSTYEIYRSPETATAWASPGINSIVAANIPSFVNFFWSESQQDENGNFIDTSRTVSVPVTSIGSFSGCTSLQSITIPSGVTSIGSFSGCTSLQSITIPSGVTSIGSFSGCTSLQSITIPSGVTAIGNYAFQNCSSLTSVTIPCSVTYIYVLAFQGCNSLTSVSMPCVTNIATQTFFDCSSLQSVSMPNVTFIGSAAFQNCTSLQSVTIPFGVTTISSSTFYGCSSLSSVAIPNSVKEIQSSAFYGCSSLVEVAIPNSVKEIQSSAFYGCSSLVEVAIPASVTEIALNAFKSCDGLQRFIVDPANPNYASYDGALYTKDLKTLVCYPGGRTDVKLPSVAVETKEDAFTGCGKLWAEWYRAFQKTRYDLSNTVEDRAITSITVDRDTVLDDFVMTDGKVYDTVLHIVNTSNGAVNLTLPKGYTYETFKGSTPLVIPANSRNVLTITRTADDSFLVAREELEVVK